MNANGQHDDRLHGERIERWVTEHGRALRGFLYGLVGDWTLAEDLMQDVFCKAWQASQRFNEEGKDRAYLLRIADRIARDALRRKKHQRHVMAADNQPDIVVVETNDPSTRLQELETQQQLQQALATLTEPQKRTLLLRFYGQLSFAEIAEIMNCPTNTVLSHCHRGLQSLRRIMAESLS